MVTILSSEDLKTMTFSKLKKHAQKLKKHNFIIKSFSDLSDTKDGLKKIRKIIRHAKQPPSSPPSSSSSSPSSPPSSPPSSQSPNTECTFQYKKDCLKDKTPKEVEKISKKCGVDTNKYTTKLDRCTQLFKKNALSAPVKSKSDNSDEYKKLNKLPKASKDKDDLQDIAKKLKITHGTQDGEKITMTKLRKPELIKEILKSKGSSVTKTSSPKKISKKKSSPVKVSKKKSTPVKVSKKKSTPVKVSKKKSTPVKVSEKKSTPVKVSEKKSTPVKVSEKKSTPVKVSESKKCGNYKYKNLLKKDIKELKEILKKKGIKKDLPKTQKGLSDYICASEDYDKCDPEKGSYCSEGFACDMNNKLCITDEMAKENNISVLKLENGKKIIGRGKDIKIIEKMLKKQKTKKLVEGSDIKESHSKQQKIDEKEAKRIIIKQIISITGEKASNYKKFTLNDIINRLDTLNNYEDIINEVSKHDMILVLENETGYPYDYFDKMSTDKIYDRYEDIMKQQKPTDWTPSWTPKKTQSTVWTPIKNQQDIDKKLMTYKEQKFPKKTQSTVWTPIKNQQDIDKKLMTYEEQTFPKKLSGSVSEDSSDNSDEESKKEDSSNEPDVSEDSSNESDVSEDSSNDSDEDDSSMDKPQEGIEIKNIQNSLVNIMDDKEGNVKNIAKIQKEITKCLGMLG
jgi:hypothetical protein